MDIFINETFDVELDDRNDLATVTGQQSAEQEVALLVNSFFYEEIGSTDERNAVENIALQTQRVVAQSDGLETVENISVDRLDTGEIEVIIDFDIGESSDFLVG